MELLRSLKRAAKESVYDFTEVELRVREATSNNKVPTSSRELEEIARSTHDYSEYPKLFAMVWKRMTDQDHPMHVNKALILTDYLVRTGADRFVQDVKLRETDLRRMFDFGRGNVEELATCESVRNKARALHTLITSEKALTAARETAERIKDVKNTSISNDSYRDRGAYSGRGSSSSGAKSSSNFDDDFERHSEPDRDDPFANESVEVSVKKASAEKKKSSAAATTSSDSRPRAPSFGDESEDPFAPRGGKGSSGSSSSDPFAADPFAASSASTGRKSPSSASDPFAAFASPSSAATSTSPASASSRHDGDASGDPFAAFAAPAPATNSRHASAAAPAIPVKQTPAVPTKQAAPVNMFDLFESTPSSKSSSLLDIDLIGSSKSSTATEANWLVDALVSPESQQQQQNPSSNGGERAAAGSSAQPSNDLWNLDGLADLNLSSSKTAKAPPVSIGGKSLAELASAKPQAAYAHPQQQQQQQFGFGAGYPPYAAGYPGGGGYPQPGYHAGPYPMHGGQMPPGSYGNPGFGAYGARPLGVPTAPQPLSSGTSLGSVGQQAPLPKQSNNDPFSSFGSW